MRIIYWNCRGAASKKFYRHVYELINMYRPDVVLETRVSSTRAQKVMNLGRFDNFSAAEARGFLGVYGLFGSLRYILKLW